MKRVLLVTAGVLVLLLVLAVLIPFVVDLNKYKDTILAQLKPYVPRDVDFDHVELTLLTGVGAEIRGLRVSENPLFGSGDFLRLKSLKVGIRVLPLLSREIKVRRITLNEPVVQLLRNAEGVFNFSDLVGGGQGPAGEEDSAAVPDGSPAAPPGGAASGPGVLAWLLVNDLEIRNGTVSYGDETLFPQAPPLEVHNLEVSAQDLSLSTPVTLRVDAGLFTSQGQNVHLTGVVGPVGESLQVEAIPFEVSCKLGPFPWESVPPSLRERAMRDTPYLISSGSLRADVEVGGAVQEEIRTRSEWHLNDVVVQKTSAEGALSSTGSMQLLVAQEAVLNHPSRSLDIRSAVVSLNGNRILLQGKVQDYLGSPRWDVDMRTEGLDPDGLIRLLPVFVAGLPKELRLEGPAEIKLHSDGTQETLRVEAHAEMGRLRVQVGDAFQKPAGVPLSVTFKGSKEGNRLNVQDVRLELYQLVVNVSGEAVTGEPTRFGLLAQSEPVGLKGWGSLVPAVSEYEPDGSLLLRMSARGTPEDATLNLQLSSDRIGFRIPGKPDAAPKAAEGVGSLSSLSLEAQARRRADQLQGSGTLNIGRGEVLAIPFERFLSRASFSEDRVDLSSVEVGVFSGTVRTAGRYGMKTGEWSFRPELKDISVEDVLNTLTEYKNVFSGRLSGTFQADGRPAAGGKTASVVSGSFRLARGELKNFDLVGDVLQALLKLQDVARFLGGLKGEVGEHASTRFAYLDGTFRLQDEKLTLDPLHLHDVATSRSTDSDAIFSGSVALDTDLLDLKGKVLLSAKDSAQLAREADVLRALLDAEGRMVFPVTIQGRIQKPVPFLDTQYVVGAITRFYARKGVEEGLGALQKKLGVEPGGTESGQKPVEDLLRQLFK